MFTDTHAHIYLPQFEDLDEVIMRSLENEVGQILMPNIDLKTIESMHEVEAAYPAICHAMMGLHPCSVDNDFEQILSGIKEQFDHRSYLAVGEIGIDLHWDKSYLEQQIEAFTIQTTWAHQRSLPIVIHSRESTEEILALLEKLALPGLTGVFHCFTGTEVQAERAIALGFVLGIGGVVTFKNGGLDKILPKIPVEKIILETDAPYLAPHPYRGKRNEPSYIPTIAMKISEVYGIPMSEVATETTGTAQELFDLLPPNQND